MLAISKALVQKTTTTNSIVNEPGLLRVGDFAEGLPLGGTLGRAGDFRIFEVVDDEIFVDGRHGDTGVLISVYHEKGQRIKL